MTEPASRQNQPGRPPNGGWSAAQQDAFCARLTALLEQLNWTPADVDRALGFSPKGCATARILGQVGKTPRRPSANYVARFEQLEANPPDPRSPDRGDGEGQSRPGFRQRRRWTADELDAFGARITTLLERLNWTPEDLDLALGYATSGRYTVRILGLSRGSNGKRWQPSANYVTRFEQLEADPPPPKPPWAPNVSTVASGQTLPAGRVDADARPCPECLAEVAEGRRDQAETWFWPGHPRARYCRQHRQAGPRRRRWFRRCLELDCQHVVSANGHDGRDPGEIFTCAHGEHCLLRRRPWTP